MVDLELSERPLDELAAEALLLRQLRHPHLLPLHCSFVAGSELWMVSPLAAGDAASLLRRRYPSGLPEPLLATLARDVLSALDYLHRQAGVTHRDVKAANVLVDDGGLALLADLGAAAWCGGGSGGGDSEVQLTTFAGSPCWMAPEVAAGEPYDWRADIWSFGITLLELARGRPPYYSLPQRELWTQLVHGEPPALEDEPMGRRWSRELKDLVARCLQRDPAGRPSAAQVSGRCSCRAQRLSGWLRRQLPCPAASPAPASPASPARMIPTPSPRPCPCTLPLQLLQHRFFRQAKGPRLVRSLLLEGPGGPQTPPAGSLHSQRSVPSAGRY